MNDRHATESVTGSAHTNADSADLNPRRSFFTAIAAIGAGAMATLAPVGAGVAAFLTPLFRKNQAAKVRIALLDQIPDDGVPRVFPIVAERRDAWTRYPQQRIGAAYLVRRPGEQQPVALTAKCPHAGCFIGYTPGSDHFQCPCHTSSFRLDGARSRGDDEVAPRDMDRLPIELKEVASADGVQMTEVWVEFIDFQTGDKEAIPTS